jgi:hypothetical protein
MTFNKLEWLVQFWLFPDKNKEYHTFEMIPESILNRALLHSQSSSTSLAGKNTTIGGIVQV